MVFFIFSQWYNQDKSAQRCGYHTLYNQIHILIRLVCNYCYILVFAILIILNQALVIIDLISHGCSSLAELLVT